VTNPVAALHSGVIGDPGQTARPDINSHLVLFPSFSRYITSWAIDISHMASGGTWKPMLPAGIGYVAGCRLVAVLVGWGLEVGLVTPTPNGHLPALFGGPRPIWSGRTTGGSGFSIFVRCPLDRAVEVNLGFSLRYGMRLVVFVPQHQTAMYETYSYKSCGFSSARYVVS
jgi:hypothetical protein